jgi:hypothetical protein
MRYTLVLPLLLLAACAREPDKSTTTPSTPAPPAPVAAPAWSDFTAGFIESRFKADPAFAVQSGRHEFDGRVPDWSRAAIEADVAALRAQRAELERFAAASLAPAQRFERQYLEWIIDRELFWLTSAEEPFRNPAWYIDRLDPSMYLTRDYAPLPKRLQGFSATCAPCRRSPGKFAPICARRCPRAFIERGAAGFTGYATFFRTEMPAIFAQLADERQKRELNEATAAAAQAMDALVPGCSRSAQPPTTLSRSAPRSSPRCSRDRARGPRARGARAGRPKRSGTQSRALAAACASFAPNATLAACVDQMRADKPAGRSVAGARTQLADLRQFVIDRKIASIPRQEQALVAESPPYNRGNFAYISIPVRTKTRRSRPPITWRRPIRSGVRTSAGPIFRGARTCCSCRRTKCGRAITCNRSSPMQILHASRHCGGTTHLPKAGRITQRR